MKPSRRALSHSFIALISLGCQVTVQSHGNVNPASTPESSAATAAAPANQEAPPAVIPPTTTASDATRAIAFKQGRLDYTGEIHFAYDQATLESDPATQKTLADFVAFLKEHPQVKLEIEGHTDSRGSDEYNLELSRRRAVALREWLIVQGVQESRLTAVGKGETAPQVPEPAACSDQHPVDPAPCEAVWAQNRRVVFSVTEGGEALASEAAAPPPVATPAPAPVVLPPAPVVTREPPHTCPWLVGGHLNALGPNSFGAVAGALQPGVCWLELSLGLGLGGGDRDGRIDVGMNSDYANDADGKYFTLTVPLRARIWVLDRHSPLVDLGLGVTHYRMQANATDLLGQDFDYRRRSTPFIGNLGIGYGFRPNGTEAGFRLALTGGLLVHLTKFKDSTYNAAYTNAAALRAATDKEMDKLHDLEPYAELSLGWLY